MKCECGNNAELFERVRTVTVKEWGTISDGQLEVIGNSELVEGDVEGQTFFCGKCVLEEEVKT